MKSNIEKIVNHIELINAKENMDYTWLHHELAILKTEIGALSKKSGNKKY